MIVHYNEHMFGNMNNDTGEALNIFIKTPEQKILSLFAMNPGLAFYTRQIAKILKMSLGTTHASLRSLEKLNFLRSQAIGKTKIFELDIQGPIIQAFRVFNTILILEPLVDELKEVSRRIVLHGSYSKGTFSKDSDLDLLVVAENKNQALKLIDEAKRKTGLDIRPLIMNQLEWTKLEQTSPEFFDEISHGIILWERPVEESGL